MLAKRSRRKLGRSEALLDCLRLEGWRAGGTVNTETPSEERGGTTINPMHSSHAPVMHSCC